MPSGFHHVTGSVRCRIRIPKDRGFSCRRTARDRKHVPSMVSRELRRNGGPDGRSSKAAQEQVDSRRHAVSSVARKVTLKLWALIEYRLTVEQ